MKGIVLTSDWTDGYFDVAMDVQRDRSGKITQGLTLGETSEQNAQLIVIAEPGEFKEYPQLGVGLHRYLKSTGREKELLRAIRVQLALDGMKPSILTFADNKLQIEL